jgi:hypothetical protein
LTHSRPDRDGRCRQIVTGFSRSAQSHPTTVFAPLQGF